MYDSFILIVKPRKIRILSLQSVKIFGRKWFVFIDKKDNRVC